MDKPDAPNIVSSFDELDTFKIAQFNQIAERNKARWTTTNY